MPILEFACDECGRHAASVELRQPSNDPNEVGGDHWHVIVDGPMSVSHWVMGDVRPIQDAMHVGTPSALWAVNPEYANFWCRECRLSYCKEHWQPIVPEMDEGFYDATYGTCPKGHTAMLDD